MKRLTLLSVVAIILFCFAAKSHATPVTYTIDFNSFTDGAPLYNLNLGGGYFYESYIYGTTQTARQTAPANLVAVDSNINDGTGSLQRLTRSDGLLFDVLSFDIADLSNNSGGGGGTGGLTGDGYRIGFTGNGSTQYSPTSSTFTTIDVSADPIFQNLSHLYVNIVSHFSSTDDFAVDNIVVQYEPIPEPATMLLFGTGLVGVAGAARRKKKNRA